MPTPALHFDQRPPLLDAESFRERAEYPALRLLPPPLRSSRATHDLLVPNPRPDLAFDPHMVRMLDDR
jgi:hypothetical protein